MAARRREFANWHSGASDNEGLATVEPPHDRAAVVAQLSLGDFPSHGLIVAHRATGTPYRLEGGA